MKKNHKTHHKAVGNDYSVYHTNDSAYKAQNRLRTVDKWKKADRSATRESAVGIFKILFLVLVFLAVLGVLKNEEIVTFQGLLDFLANAPQFDLEWLNWSSVSLGDWGVFNFLRDFFELNISFINVLLFIGTMGVQLITYLLYFLKFIFL